jgi:hypothetical protein
MSRLEVAVGEDNVRVCGWCFISDFFRWAFFFLPLLRWVCSSGVLSTQCLMCGDVLVAGCSLFDELKL